MNFTSEQSAYYIPFTDKTNRKRKPEPILHLCFFLQFLFSRAFFFISIVLICSRFHFSNWMCVEARALQFHPITNELDKLPSWTAVAVIWYSLAVQTLIFKNEQFNLEHGAFSSYWDSGSWIVTPLSSDLSVFFEKKKNSNVFQLSWNKECKNWIKDKVQRVPSESIWIWRSIFNDSVVLKLQWSASQLSVRNNFIIPVNSKRHQKKTVPINWLTYVRSIWNAQLAPHTLIQ